MRALDASIDVFGLDNLSRRGSEINRDDLIGRGVRVFHGDLRSAADIESLPAADWVIDAAALPSVLAGVDGNSSPRQLIEHNLIGTLNLLEYVRRHGAGFVLLSTSRVYSITPLASLPLTVVDDAFVPSSVAANRFPRSGWNDAGIDESFATTAPVSLYGATKLASETLAAEYAETYDLPVWINRCGVMAGGGQFGRPDQGIFAFWIHSHRARRPLRYIGFGGGGYQVRDCLHPNDLTDLILKQMRSPRGQVSSRIFNVSGGVESARSLKQLTNWCDDRFGIHAVVGSDQTRPFDLPWVVLDSTKARESWDWQPRIGTEAILHEIADHAAANPNWLERTC